MQSETTLSRAEEVAAFIARTPFAQELGMHCEVMGDEMTAVLPFRDKLVGNVAIRAIHGGAIGAFLEITAGREIQTRHHTDGPLHGRRRLTRFPPMPGRLNRLVRRKTARMPHEPPV